MAGMFILLRRIERWLHQHIFKVGWLSTHDYQTTTILYYTFFLPGVILHEFVYYLAAGILNVRAERQIKWPDKQEIGELKLNFIKLAPRTSAFRKAIITSMPLLVGLISIWFVSNNIFDITAVVERMSSGELADVGAAFNMLIGAPLFWLWIYIIFTIANTMFPTVPKDLQGWRSVLIGLGVVGVALFLVGIGGEIFEALQSPLSTVILVLSQTFVLLICIDLLMVLVLGTIEYSIERATGHSATFKGNRMVTMTREEAIAEREKERAKEQKKLEREQRQRAAITEGPTTIYGLAFAIPGAPGDIPITQLEALPDVEEDIPEETQDDKVPPISMPAFGGILRDDNPASQPLSNEQKQQREAIAARINLPERRQPMPTPSVSPNVDDVEADDKPKTVSQPARFTPQRPITPLVDDEREQVVPSRFGKPASDDTDTDDEQTIAPVASRFGSRPELASQTDEEVTNLDVGESIVDEDG
ncbi:MAG: hypothetical protein WBC91_26045, partial [Phototrophicaceae bacterium]